ncbi:MAG: PIF1 family DEAD/DEAH box helicase [bacterium]
MNQQQALEILKLGHNAYLTGPAGSGKTYLLNQYIAFLKNKNVNVGVTASTGIAATHMNGRTIHSWSGLGIKDQLRKKDIEDMLKKSYLVSRLRSAGVLIIDEISMFHNFHLDMVDEICRSLRGLDLPFGGLQVILCGDFFQLPPVNRNGSGSDFVVNSQAWQEMDIKICYLDQQFRQADAEFLKLLTEIRQNQISEECLNNLLTRIKEPVDGPLTPTKLYTHNADVDAVNNLELAMIKNDPMTYEMTSRGNKNLVRILKDSCLAPQTLILKEGALVMFVQNNFEKGYVNGTLGKIIGFDNSNLPIVETKSGDRITASPGIWTIEEGGSMIAKISQIPLRLAWAITVHKSQGMSLDSAEIDLSKAFALGMGYVALSRVRTLEGIKLLGINDMALKVDPAIVELDQEFSRQSQTLAEQLGKMKAKAKKQKQEEFLKRARLSIRGRGFLG